MSIPPDQETQRLIEREIRAGGFRDAAAFVGAAVPRERGEGVEEYL